MRIVNENEATREIVLRRREGGEPSGEVEREVCVRFGDGGVAEVEDEVGRELVEQHDSIREARDSLAEVEFASDEAAEIALEEGLTAEDFRGEEPSGKTGHTADDARRIAESA